MKNLFLFLMLSISTSCCTLLGGGDPDWESIHGLVERREDSLARWAMLVSEEDPELAGDFRRVAALLARLRQATGRAAAGEPFEGAALDVIAQELEEFVVDEDRNLRLRIAASFALEVVAELRALTP